MSHLPIDMSKNPTPIRLFKSDALEFFTHIAPGVVLIIWLPVVAYFLARSIIDYNGEYFPVYIPAGFLLGIFLWTFIEYTLHRFVFHFPARGKRQERIIFLFHGIHHVQPQCKTRLVMPPAVSIPLAFVFYGLFYLVFATWLGIPWWVHPLFAGTIFGYLTYDMIHYATHHLPMHSGYAKFLKRYHMQHHYKTPNQRYGVSSPLWDLVFRTIPQD
jgi:sterol desaturase/sphingolipid hydroxylase (fatty acid hydroxylase superfamily)